MSARADLEKGMRFVPQALRVTVSHAVQALGGGAAVGRPGYRGPRIRVAKEGAQTADALEKRAVLLSPALSAAVSRAMHVIGASVGRGIGRPGYRGPHIRLGKRADTNGLEKMSMRRAWQTARFIATNPRTSLKIGMALARDPMVQREAVYTGAGLAAGIGAHHLAMKALNRSDWMKRHPYARRAAGVLATSAVAPLLRAPIRAAVFGYPQVGSAMRAMTTRAMETLRAPPPPRQMVRAVGRHLVTSAPWVAGAVAGDMAVNGYNQHVARDSRHLVHQAGRLVARRAASVATRHAVEGAIGHATRLASGVST